MSDWNGKVRCFNDDNGFGFTKNKVYKVINGTIINDKGVKQPYSYKEGHKYENIDELNEDLCLMFEEIFTPKLCEILGVEVDEKFKIDFKTHISDYEYFINDRGNLLQIGENFNDNANNLVVPIINGEYTIIKLPFYQFNEDEIITLKALWINGYEYIARDNDDDLWAYDGMPKEDDGVYDNEIEWYYTVKLNSDLFQQVQGDIVLDISFELSKVN